MNEEESKTTVGEEQQQTGDDETREDLILYNNKETTEVRWIFDHTYGKFKLLTMPWFMKNAPEETKTATIEWLRQCAINEKIGKPHPKIPEITLEWRMRPEEVFRLSDMSRDDFLKLMINGKKEYSKAYSICKV